ncbi:hypothetical protein BD779DRAFT_1682084 [Infundibulicybe gibba]|nr:hypothetical protein BD779DRAFT_1682084 [Infundibulicybe gibba]
MYRPSIFISRPFINFTVPKSKSALTEEQVTSLLLPHHSIKPTRVSPYLKQTASLSYNPVTKLYLLNGRSCQHTGNQSTQSCVALEALNLRWCLELQSIIDTAQKSIVISRCLPAFLEQITNTTLVNAECLILHLCDVYNINTSETEDDLKSRFKGLLLTESIPHLSQPVLRYQCNLCHEWFPRIARHRYDVLKTDRFPLHPAGEILENDKSKRHFILPLQSGTGATLILQKSLKVMLVVGFISPTNLNQEHAPHGLETSCLEESPAASLTVPAYVDSLCWLEQLEKAKESPLTFLEIQSLACGARISKKTWISLEGSPLLPVEDFLFSLPCFVREYLKGAEWRISSMHCGVRGLVTARWVQLFLPPKLAAKYNHLSTKGAFRALSNHTLDEYGLVVRSVIAFCLRWLALQRHEPEKVVHFTQMGWEPKWIGNQLGISTGFLDTLLSHSGNNKSNNADQDEYHNLVMEYIHKFLVSSFSTAFTDGGGIGSIVEQTIMLNSFSSVHGWQRASRICNGPLKAWQNISRSVSIHCAILGGMSSKYERIFGDKQAPSRTTSTAEEEGSDVSALGDDNSDSDGDDSDDSDDDSDDSDLEILDFSVISALTRTQTQSVVVDAQESQESERIVKFFKTDASVFKARNTAYQWGRCSTIWSIMLSMSKAEGSVTKVEWSPDGYTFAFKSSYASVSVEVDDFRQSVLELPGSIWQSFLQLFPASYPPLLLNEIHKLDTTVFHDDPDNPDSLFSRKDNSARIHPYYDALKDILQQQQTIAVCEQYQENLPKFQAGLLYGIMTCNGISMRSAQVAQLRFSASDGFPRNLYIDGAQCYIGKPAAKQKHTGHPYYEAYWLLHSRIALALLLYRLIFRPLEPVLLLQHVKCPDLDTSELLIGGMDCLFIKVLSHRGQQQKLVSWDGKDVNRVLRAAGSPLCSESRVYRHFTKAFVRKFLSPQAIQISQAHSRPERQTSLPNSRQMQKDLALGRKEQLAFSAAVHQLFGLKPQLENITSALYRVHALQCARHLVIAQYQLCGDNQQLIRDRVLHLVSIRPFIYGDGRASNRNMTWTTLGDRALIEVTAETLYGPARPSALEDTMPYDGYPSLPVAVALNMIWTAIHEWDTGSYCPSLQFTEESSHQAEKIFLEGINNFRSKQRSGWIKFCLEVHKHATRCLSFTDHNSLPHIVPPVKLLHLDTSFQSGTYAQIPALTRRPLNLQVNNFVEQEASYSDDASPLAL